MIAPPIISIATTSCCRNNDQEDNDNDDKDDGVEPCRWGIGGALGGAWTAEQADFGEVAAAVREAVAVEGAWFALEIFWGSQVNSEGKK